MDRFVSSRRAIIAAACVTLLTNSFSLAQSVADTVVSYDATNAPVTYGGDPYNIASGALGLPQGDTGYGCLTPFNAPFDRSQIVGIGAGGSLVLHMSQPIATSGRTLGIHAAVGLVDMSYPAGQASAPAMTYTDPRNASVSVSSNGSTWVNLGSISFDVPTNYYAQGVTTPGYQAGAGTAAADFAKPFTGTLDDFSGKSWPQMLTILNGSAGGTWLDLSSSGLSQVNYVKFDVGAGQKMYVDSIVGVPVPEPAAALGAVVLTSLISVRRPRLGSA